VRPKERRKGSYKKSKRHEMQNCFRSKDENLAEEERRLHEQAMQNRNSENLEATINMIARTKRIANARLKFDSTILSLSWSVKPNVVDKADSLNHHHHP